MTKFLMKECCYCTLLRLVRVKEGILRSVRDIGQDKFGGGEEERACNPPPGWAWFLPFYGRWMGVSDIMVLTNNRKNWKVAVLSPSSY